MRIVSDRYTNRIRNEAGDLEYVPPGTEFDVSSEKAREKIAAGRAESADARAREEIPVSTEPPANPNPPAPTTETPPGGDGNPGGEGPGDLEQLQEAILNLDSDDEANFLEDGRPRIEPLAEALGRKVTAAERDAAWSELQSD